MSHKLSIGIDVDAHVKKMLAKQTKQWQNLPLRLHAPETYHVPLLQLGWVHEDSIADIVMTLSEVVTEKNALNAAFSEIAPVWKKRENEGDLSFAQSLWCKGEKSDELMNLYTTLMDALEIPHGEMQSFAPHIVLGQMRAKLWTQLEAYPDMQMDFPLDVDVMHLTLFEEASENGKRTFLPLEVFELQ